MLGTKTDYAGRDGFQWWVGEVESVEDPIQQGRVKVRVVGWYQKGKVGEDGASPYLEDLPTEALPWATVLLPTDRPQIKNAGSTCELQVGAFVMGFFMDGDEAQLPVVLGAFRGMKKKANQGGKDEDGQDTEVKRTTIADGKEAAKNFGGISKMMKGVAKAAKGIRIPIVGPIIVAISSLLSGDPPTKTLFKAVGTGLGEAFGTLIPIPVVGTIVGGLLGVCSCVLSLSLWILGRLSMTANILSWISHASASMESMFLHSSSLS